MVARDPAAIDPFLVAGFAAGDGKFGATRGSGCVRTAILSGPDGIGTHGARAPPGTR